jgi:general secretion pathway protein C
LIARPGNPEDVFKIGDTIEGAEIIGIEPKRVVIRRNGNMEALTLAIPKMKADLADRPVSSSGFARSGIRRISDNERVVSQQSLRQQLNNLPGLLQQARAVPHTVNGQPQGFKVVEIQAGSVFEDLGLQRNDVIQSVNGTPIRSTEDALQAYRDLRTSDSFQVGLLRSGRSMTLNLSVQ